MKKRAFLVPLAVSVAVLLGQLPIVARASTEPTSDPTVTALAGTPTESGFVLTRAAGATMRLADHESHSSHSSHSSHASHSSHVSGN